jgi:hypothetical protein
MIDLDGLKWTTYRGSEWTSEANLVSYMTKPESDHYYDMREHIKGQELDYLRGGDLVEYNAAHLAAHGEPVKSSGSLVCLVDRTWVEYYIEHITTKEQMIDIDKLKWTTYNGTEWTLASTMSEGGLVTDTPPEYKDYFIHRQHITRGRELRPTGTDLAEYKAAHFSKHGKTLKGAKVVVLDIDRVDAYIKYMESVPSTTTNPTEILDTLKWTTYDGVAYTLANRINPTDRNHYNNNRKYLHVGLELTLSGNDLVRYKEAHHRTHYEVIRAPKLVLIDRVRAMAYLEYLTGTRSNNEVPTIDTALPNEHKHDVMDLLLGTTTNKTILEELISITQSKGLHWVPYDGGIYLPMTEASLAKGMEKDDYSSNWQGTLPGISKLLEGPALDLFKANYVKEYGSWPYKYVRSLRIGDWEHAYAYLVQGKSPTATTFQSMGARSIQQTVEHTSTASKMPTPVRCPETWTCEEGLVDRVFKLMEMSTIKMQREACLFNTLGNTPTTRRVDAIQHLVGTDGVPRVHVYEFKKGAITAAHVADAVATKGYVQLVRERYPGSKVCLYMVGTEVDPQAQRLLECMRGVMFLPLTALLNIIVTDIMQSWPKEGHYQLRAHFLSQYTDILPPEMLSGPVDMPLPTATYHKPIAPQMP